MTMNVPRLQALALMAMAALLAGCPPEPSARVTPKALNFGDSAQVLNFTIFNEGGGTLEWTVEEVSRADGDSPWLPAEIPWLSATPTAGTTTTETDRIFLTANRTGQPVGTYTDSGIRVTSNGGTEIIPVSMTIAATLTVSPTIFTLSGTATETSFSILNSGTQPASWNVRYLTDPDDLDTAGAIPSTINVTPASGTTQPGSTDTVDVSWESGQENFYLYVESTAGTAVVRFQFGAALEGLEVAPSPLTLYVDSESVNADELIEQTPSILNIQNVGAVTRSWVIQAVNSVNPNAGAPISILPSSGTTSPGVESEVKVVVSDARDITAGSGVFNLIVTSGDATLVVPIVIEILPIPVIEISDAPNPEDAQPTVKPIDTLDFGRDELQQEFWVVNIGSRGSQLYFKVTHEDEGLAEPLIVGLTPAQGDTTGSDQDFYISDYGDYTDGVPVTVTVDRANMTEDVETRTITVEAWDQDFQNQLEIVDSKTITIRVERPPLQVEGALNRSRPPFVERYVLLLRDTTGQVIPTRTAEDLERLNMVVYEDEVLLDPDETNQFLQTPDDLRVNLVLMLDFTGSMYNAGTGDSSNPLQPGDAVETMKRAASLFLDDLPPGYRVAVMYYNDRQQLNRVIHQFSTDRASLKSALDAFTLSPAQYGVSTMRDALIEAMALLVSEDPAETLPFDDADLRAVVYLTDGVDNASEATENDLATAAEESHTRLYPVAYSASGETVDYANLLVQATDSGGHLYYVDSVSKFTTVLGSTESLVIEPSDLTDTNTAYFKVSNIGSANISWTAEVTEGDAWISNVAPGGSILLPGESALVSVQLDPSGLTLGERVEGEIAINSAAGDGAVLIRMTPADNGAGGVVADNLSLQLNDSPGELWDDLGNQIVFTYITPKQVAFVYRLVARFMPAVGAAIQGQFQRDGLFYPGDVLAGQIAMNTTGITEDLRAETADETVRAEVYVRTDYVPRNVNRFRMRFFTSLPEDVPAGAAQALANAEMKVELAPGGLLDTEDAYASGWRLVSEGDGVYLMLTEQSNYLQYGAFGNLLKVTFTGLDDFVNVFSGLLRKPEFYLEMRVDNQIYVSPATDTRPSDTKYFLYPAGPMYPDRKLSVILDDNDTASPADSIDDLASPGIDPEADAAWDRDEDGLPDFNDPYPDDEGLPGQLVVPNPLQIDVTQTSGTLTIRNNRLDTFTWNIDPASLPSWITGITYGNPAGTSPDTELSPGESEIVHLAVDRTGLPAGSSVQATLVVQSDFFADEEVLVRLFTPAE